jgi:small subunit ribosomal protein S6
VNHEYEIMLMLDPEIAEERANEIIQRIRDSVDGSDGGKWDGHEPWGRRRLAYEIDHKGEAIYHLLLFTAAPETLAEISRVLKITDGVMRHLAVRRVKGGHLKAPPQVAVTAPAASAPPPPPAPEPEAEPEPAAVAAASEGSDDGDGAAE